MDKITKFWGEYRWLSNFWVSPIDFQGRPYPTVEHFYQTAKCCTPGDAVTIRNCSTPGQAKRMGGRMAHREDWEDIKVAVMLLGVTLKFNGHPGLMKKLGATAPMILEEGNHWGDTFWGVDEKTGEGQNMLGRLLMLVRDGGTFVTC